MSDSFLVVELNQQPIELYKLLKIADLVSGGGEAKVAISQGYVLLNGEVEIQKRKKIYHEDIIEFNGEVIQLIVNESLNDETYEEAVELIHEEPDNKKSSTNDKENKSDAKTTKALASQPAQPKKRRPISF